MSYILEALKKAQAERQIGSTPTIHAPTLASVPAGQGARGRRTPVIVAMALMAAAIAGLATMLVRQQPPVAKLMAAPAPTAPSASTAAAAGVAPAAAGAAPQTVVGPSDATAGANAAAPAAAVSNAAAALPATSRSAVATPPGSPAPSATSTVAAKAAPRNVDANPSQAVAAAADSRRAEVAMAQAAVPAAAPAQPASAPQSPSGRVADAGTRGVAPPAPVEEHVQSLQELPEPIQRAIPQIALGGYMYSKNPADRLLLIDKVLRREGEEVAPGLVLDKLLPKQAIFSFRGYRYRVPL